MKVLSTILKRSLGLLVALVLCAANLSSQTRRNNPSSGDYAVLLRSLITNANEEIRSVSFSPDQQVLAAGIADGTVRLWRVSDGKPLRTLTGHKGTPDLVAFNADGSILATGDHSEIRLWRVDNGGLIRTFKPADGKTEFLNGFALSSNGQVLAAITNEATTLWRVSDGSLLRTIARGQYSYTEPSKGGFSVVFSSDGQMLFTDGRRIKQWRVSDGRLIGFLAGEQEFHPLAVDLSGHVLAAGDYGQIHVLQLSDGRQTCNLTAQGMVGETEGLSFSPNGNVLVSSNLGETNEWDNKIRLWRIDECRQIQTIPKSPSSYYHLAFSRDGKLLAVGGSQSKAKTSYGVIRLFQIQGN